MTLLHKTAWIALISILVLVFVGAIVRATGSGLGCPDWPTCWGCLIPPTSVDQVDVEKLDIEKFRKKAARYGRDPETITRETILESFNPMHTWIEFVNRLTSLPLGLSTMVLAFLSFRATRHRKWIVLLAWLSFLDVLFNAWMGAVVVRSGLKPGIITMHMALAFLLICFLATVVWLTRDPAKTPALKFQPGLWKRLMIVSVLFFVCLFVEGILGSQVREQTDQLAKAAGDIPREKWIGALSSTTVYLVHRSFAWTLLLTSVGMLLWSRLENGSRPLGPKIIFGIVIAMMLMGIVLAHIGVFKIVQVLHVGLTAVLLTATWLWLMDLLVARRA